MYVNKTASVLTHVCTNVCAEEPTPLGIEDDDDLPTPVRNPTSGQLQELERRLHALQEEKLDVNVPLYVGHDIASGFPTYVVMFHVRYVAYPDDLEELYLVWNYLQEIMEIILKMYAIEIFSVKKKW